MLKTLAFVLTAGLAACAGHAHVSATAPMPSMVAISPGSDVNVVADSNEPVFYTDNTFWLYRDNTWFRSDDYRGGWARVESVPDKLRRIDNPVAYVHFHGNGNVNAYNQAPPPADDVERRMQMQDDSRNQAPLDQPSPTTREPNPQSPSQPIPNAPLPQNQVPPTPDSNNNSLPNATPAAPEPNQAPDVPRMHSMNDPTDTQSDRERSIAPDKQHDRDTKDTGDKNPSDSK